MSVGVWGRWRGAAGLVALSLVPVAAGAARMAELGGPGPVTAENARFFASPVPIVLHVVSVTLFSLLGAVQFPTARWARGRRWHRLAGRVAAPSGVVAAVTGLWMSGTYPQPPTEDYSLEIVRFAAGGFMVFALVAGVRAVRSRDVARHRAWMIRGYAVGLGAGTQVLTHVPYALVAGTPTGTVRTLLMAAGWVLNLAVAEWVIRAGTPRPRPVRGRRPSPQPAAPRLGTW
jgi:uncharacterized membrane protein